MRMLYYTLSVGGHTLTNNGIKSVCVQCDQYAMPAFYNAVLRRRL